MTDIIIMLVSDIAVMYIHCCNQKRNGSGFTVVITQRFINNQYLVVALGHFIHNL